MRLLAALLFISSSVVIAAESRNLEDALRLAHFEQGESMLHDIHSTENAIFEASRIASGQQENTSDFFQFEESAHLDNHEPLADVPYSSADVNDLLAVDPVPGARISSHYGKRGARQHYGIDLAAATGTPIYATGSGLVTFAGSMSGYGRMVEIDHGNGYKTRYGHPSAIYVQKGDYVKVKQKIAAVGCAGRCSGPHLHYEVRRNGKPINPAPFIAMARE